MYFIMYSLIIVIIIVKVMLISGLVVTYPFVAFAQGVQGSAFQKKPLAPLQSHLHQHLVSSIIAVGAECR